MKALPRYLATTAVVLLAVAVALLKYWDYVANPWTRDGQVRADVVQITPRVSGPLVELAVEDNQSVQRGDLLFRIDPRTFEASLAQAEARYDQALDDHVALERQVDVARAKVKGARAAIQQAESAIREAEATISKYTAEFKRQQELLPNRATSERNVEAATAALEIAMQQRVIGESSLAQARAALEQAEAAQAEAEAKLGALGDENARIREARAVLKQARLDLEFTEVRAPVDGYITNMNLQQGSQAVANQPLLALIDVDSFWVDGFFRETVIAGMREGDEAIVTLMSYPDSPLEGRVESLGWGISQDDGATGHDLLVNINPTFEWIRLAQRVPVRIRLTHVPDDVALRVGTTASVLVKASSGSEVDRGP